MGMGNGGFKCPFHLKILQFNQFLVQCDSSETRGIYMDFLKYHVSQV